MSFNSRIEGSTELNGCWRHFVSEHTLNYSTYSVLYAYTDSYIALLFSNMSFFKVSRNQYSYDFLGLFPLCTHALYLRFYHPATSTYCTYFYDSSICIQSTLIHPHLFLILFFSWFTTFVSEVFHFTVSICISFNFILLT